MRAREPGSKNETGAASDSSCWRLQQMAGRSITQRILHGDQNGRERRTQERAERLAGLQGSGVDRRFLRFCPPFGPFVSSLLLYPFLATVATFSLYRSSETQGELTTQMSGHHQQSWFRAPHLPGQGSTVSSRYCLALLAVCLCVSLCLSVSVCLYLCLSLSVSVSVSVEPPCCVSLCWLCTSCCSLLCLRGLSKGRIGSNHLLFRLSLPLFLPIFLALPLLFPLQPSFSKACTSPALRWAGNIVAVPLLCKEKREKKKRRQLTERSAGKVPSVCNDMCCSRRSVLLCCGKACKSV